MAVEPRTTRFGPWAFDSVNLLWLAAGGVLLCEYLAVSFFFDSAEVARRGGVWVAAAQVGALAPMAVAVATALLLFHSEPQDARPPGGPFPTGRRFFRLAVHAVSFAAFVAVTLHVFGRAEAPRSAPWAWLAAWGVLGAGSAVALFAGLVGVRLLLRRVLSGWVLAGVGLGTAAWLAGRWSNSVLEPLVKAALYGAGGLLTFANHEVVVDPVEMVLALEDFAVTVAPVCSGVEGMGLISVLLIGYLVVLRSQFRFPHAILLVPIGIVAVWIGNTVRLASLMLIGAYVDPNVALGGFHSKAGWVLFCAIALGIAALARRSSFFSLNVAETEEPDNPTAAYLMPLVAMVATGLVTTMFAGVVDPFYGARLLPAAAMLYVYRRHYAELVRAPSLLSLGAGAVVGTLWVVSTSGSSPAPTDQVGVVWIVVRLIGSVIAVPICEELAFRGYLLRRLVSSEFLHVAFTKWSPIAILVSSATFGLLHDRWLAATLAGGAYALVQLRSGRFVDAVAAHAVTNAVIAAASLATGDWSAWN